MDPRSNGIVLTKEGAEEELVRSVEDLNDLMQDCQGCLILELDDIGLYDSSKSWSDLLHYGVKRLSLFLQIVLVLLGKAKQCDTPGQNSFIVA